MAVGGRLALIFSVGVTFGASLKVFVEDAHKRERMELEQQGFFKDLFEFAEEKFHMAEEAFKGAFMANKGKANTQGYYVDKYEAGRDFAYWDLCNCNVTSNLGGMGPDTDAPPELRFSNVMDATGVGPVDLVVTASGDYTPKNESANGIYHCFGIINVAADAEVDLTFGFKKAGTLEPVTFSTMYFTIYDMDTGKHGEGVEEVTVYDDVDELFQEDDCLYDKTGNLSTGLTLTATTEGTGDDNPAVPDNITELQRKKSVTAKYTNKDTWTLSFDVAGGDGGRNMMFAGESPPGEGQSTCRVAGDCVIWGDPHVITFDATQKLAEQYPNRREFLRIRNRKMEEVNVFDEGNFWIVKSKDVHIQGRYNLRKEHAKRTVLGGLAIGGPFLKNNTFIIRPLTGKITWNGKEVLKHLGSTFTKHKLIHAKYHKGAESVSDGRKGDGIDITLPGSVKLTVNRFERGLAVKVSMCAQEWQDGQCGNFNGDADDDKQDFLMSRVQPLRRKEKLPWREHRHLAASAKKQAKVHHHHA